MPELIDPASYEPLQGCPSPRTCSTCAHAMRAIDLARVRTNLHRASDELTVAQRLHRRQSCWTGAAMLEAAAGVIAFCGHDHAESFASLERALVFARRDAVPAMRAEVEAWVALSLYAWRPNAETATRLRECAVNVLHLSGHASPAAQYRIAASLAVHYAQVGLRDRMDWWFERARRYADLSDDAAIRAALRRQIPVYEAWNIRRRHVAGAAIDTKTIDATMAQLQRVMDADYPDPDSYGHTQLLLHRAWLLMIEDKFEDAAPLLDHCVPIAMTCGMGDETSISLSDRAICRLHAGELLLAQQDIDEAARRVDSTLDAYTAAIVYYNIAAFHRTADRPVLAKLAARTATDWLRLGQDGGRAIRAALRRQRGALGG